MATRIHETALCSTDQVGEGVEVGAYCVISPSVLIADAVHVSSHVTIAEGVRIDSNVKIGAGARIGRDCVIEINAVIGQNAVIMDATRIEMGACVTPGTRVSMSVPAYAIVEGSSGTITGYVDASIQGLRNLHHLSDQQSAQSRLRGVSTHELRYFPDLRGSLSVGEFETELPFIPKRFFLVSGVSSERIRGEHAHRRCHQFLICAHGTCAVIADDGKDRQEFRLDRPNFGVHLPPMIWGIQYKFSRDAVLLVFASEHYDSDDYIRSYKEFLKLIN
jgi:carbonic anhydrase/acetyltransferase-like protein (isoleucine patch superfamily)